MPRVRRHNLPPQLLAHLLDRIQRRNISAGQLGLLANWLDTEPEVPNGKWWRTVAVPDAARVPKRARISRSVWTASGLPPLCLAEGHGYLRILNVG
jgi:hypothetical protein